MEYENEEYQEQPQFAYPQQQQQYYPQMPQAEIPISRDRDFMQWLFNFKEEVTAPLIHIWRGEEEISPGEWRLPALQDRLIIMNEKGITWSISFISSFINPVYIVSNYDETAMNWTMRKIGRVVWNSLSKRYEEFALKKTDIPRVAMEIISKVHAILLGARGNGYRQFFMSTHHVDEVKTTQQNAMPPQSGGWGLFKSKPKMMAQMGY